MRIGTFRFDAALVPASRWRGVTVGSMILMWACFAVVSLAEARDDWQWWHGTTIPVVSESSYQLSLQQFVRLRDDISEPFWVQHTVRNAVKLSEHWTVAAHYSFIRSKGTAKWKDEHRPEVEVTPSWSAAGLEWKNRTRVEARMIQFDDGEINWRFRNQIQAAKPLTIGTRTVTVFANEEFFYDVAVDAWNQNRVYVGLSAPVNRHVSVTVAWGVQSVKTGADWDDRQLVSTSVNVKF